MTSLQDITLAILVGGAGLRMGTPKAWLVTNGVPILERIHTQLAWPGPTMLVTVSSRLHPPGFELFDREVIDAVEQGPLQGVATALTNSQTEITLVMPVDMLGMSKRNLQWLANELASRPTASALMLRRRTNSGESIEPLPLACRATLADMIAEQLEAGDRSLRGLLKQRNVRAIEAPRDWTEKTWLNLNSPEDLTQLER